MCHCLSGWINPGIIALFSSIAWGSFTWKQSKTWPPPIKTWSSQYAYWLNPCFCSLMMPFYVSVYLHFCWFGSPFCWICSLLLKIVSSCDLVLFRIMSAFDQQTQVYWIRGERLPQEKGDVLLKPSHTQLNNQFKKKTLVFCQELCLWDGKTRLLLQTSPIHSDCLQPYSNFSILWNGTRLHTVPFQACFHFSCISNFGGYPTAMEDRD